MKLFSAYNRINLVSTVIIFLLASTAFYFSLRFVLIDQVDESLKIEQREVESYISKYRRMPEMMSVKDQQLRYRVVEHDGGKRFFRTVKTNNAHDSDDYQDREIVFYEHTEGKWYEVVVSKSMEGTDDITKSIVSITVVTLLLILLTSLVINRIVLRRLWKPFYNTMSVMQDFELGKMQEPAFPATAIDEFSLMNDTLRDATVRARQEYISLKEFTENASHELQTPLAIIRSRLDMLIQDERLTEAQSLELQSIYEALQKMARLNQSLLLLAKIDNGQYSELSDIDLSQKLAEKVSQFEELIKAKQILVKKEMPAGFYLSIHPSLADILLNNLLSNAVKFTPAGGIIFIRSGNGFLEIGNTGGGKPLDAQQLFRRFGKPGDTLDGIGLGLAIVKQISDFNQLGVEYQYRDDLHVFTFSWPPSPAT